MYYNLGLISANKGQDTIAVAYWNHTLKLNPKFADAYYGLGVIAGKHEMIEDKIKYFQLAARNGNMKAQEYLQKIDQKW